MGRKGGELLFPGLGGEDFGPGVEPVFVSGGELGGGFAAGARAGRVGELRGVDGLGGGEFGEVVGREGLVVLDGVDDGLRQAPEGEEVGADFDVRSAEGGFLALGQAFGAARRGQDFDIALAEATGEDEFADIVEQAAEKRLFGLGAGGAFEAGDFAGGEGDAHGVAPEFLATGAGLGIGVVKIEDVDAEGEGAEDFDPDDLDGIGGGKNLLGAAELRGVDDLQQLHGEAGVLFDDGADIFDGAVGGIEEAAEAQVGFGRRGQGAGAADEAPNIGVFDEVVILADAAEQLGQLAEVKGFMKEAMAEGEAFGDLLAIGKAGDDDAGRFGMVLDDFGEEFDAIDFRHGEIADDDVEAVFAQKVERLRGAGSGVDFMAIAEDMAHGAIDLAHGGFVIHE